MTRNRQHHQHDEASQRLGQVLREIVARGYEARQAKRQRQAAAAAGAAVGDDAGADAGAAPRPRSARAREMELARQVAAARRAQKRRRPEALPLPPVDDALPGEPGGLSPAWAQGPGSPAAAPLAPSRAGQSLRVLESAPLRAASRAVEDLAAAGEWRPWVWVMAALTAARQPLGLADLHEATGLRPQVLVPAARSLAGSGLVVRSVVPAGASLGDDADPDAAPGRVMYAAAASATATATATAQGGAAGAEPGRWQEWRPAQRRGKGRVCGCGGCSGEAAGAPAPAAEEVV